MADVEAKHNKVGRPMKFPDPIAFSNMINAYLDGCKNNDEIVTVYGCAKYMGCDDETLTLYKDKGEVYSDALKILATAGKISLIERGMAARNPAMHIFLLKACYGLTEISQINVNNVASGYAERLQAAESRNKITNVTPSTVPEINV